MRTDAKTGLIGKPLGHSFSPAIHAALGDPSYALMELEPGELEAFFRSKAFAGVNVTIPYKQAVLPLLDEIDPKAARIGAVNTVVNRGGRLTGYNTDYDGFLALAARAGISFAGKKVAVLGSGGTSHTVCAAARDAGAAQVVVVSRCGQCRYDTPQRYADAQIVVNTTPVGMSPACADAPIDLTAFANLCGVLDVIYNPRRTRLIAQAEALGVPCGSGLPMLVHQAAASHALFTGDAPDAAAAERVLGELYVQTANLVLIGMPGSGKSALGQRCAALLQHPFFDADALVAEQAGCSIPEIFSQEGEAGFRQRESAVLAALSRHTGSVIATGGGAVLRADNVAALRQNGFLVHLERAIGLLDMEGRPLSTSREALLAMARERFPLYQAAADLTLCNDGNADAAAERIVKEFYAHFSH
ncbi:MAG: shikimate kinase [Eubacteriales bacterium]|nr:shikimate kinase [Eubacteriales bacterium]